MSRKLLSNQSVDCILISTLELYFFPNLQLRHDILVTEIQLKVALNTINHLQLGDLFIQMLIICCFCVFFLIHSEMTKQIILINLQLVYKICCLQINLYI